MNKVFDRYASLVFLLVGIGFVWQSFNISASSYGSTVGPNIFPMGLGALLILLSLRLFYEVLRSKGGEGGFGKLDYKRFFMILGAALLYAYFIEDIGYVIGTFVFLLFSFQVMQRGKLVRSIVISALFSICVFVLFVEVLEGSLPGFPSWLT